MGQADLVAGLTTAAVLLPKAMTYATIAGLMLCGAGLLRFGFIANFISETTLQCPRGAAPHAG